MQFCLRLKGQLSYKQSQQQKFTNQLNCLMIFMQYGLFLEQSLLKLKYFPPILMDVSSQFIHRLFSHPQFRESFQVFWGSFDYRKTEQKEDKQSLGMDSVAEEIVHLLQVNFKTALQSQCSHLYQSNRHILEELQHIKSQLKVSPTLKTESSTAQRDTNPKLQTSIFFQTDSQYDMKQIRKQFDDQIQNRILVNSFQIDEQQRTSIEQEIEERINASVEGSISRIELTLEEKFQKYSAKIEQRIQQLRKTIASVVEAMNEREVWNCENGKTVNSSGKYATQNAFTKKEIRSQQMQKQNQQYNRIDTIQQHENLNRLLVKHTLTTNSKQKQKTLSNPYPNPNKTIESLNKSINLGRTKIKSLFGFKSQTANKQSNGQ